MPRPGLRRLGAPPWSITALRSVVVADVAAVALLVIGYLGADQQHKLASELAWLDVAMLGSVVSATATGWWLLIGRRSVSLCRRELLARRPRIRGPRLPDDRAAETDDIVVTVEDSTWYHRPGCVLVRGKTPLEGVDGRDPCPICDP